MKKMKLELENLQVDSFETVAPADGTRGTVHGHATLVCTDQYSCDSNGGSGLDDSCGATCGGPCGPQTYVMHGCYEME